MSHPSLPGLRVVHATGGPVERGRQYGAGAHDLIARTVAGYEALFGGLGIAWREACELAERFVDPIRAAAPDVLGEIQGIAQGAGLRPEEVLAINCRTEIFRWARRANHECTAVAALPEATADGITLLGQTWDWHPAFRDVVMLLAKRVAADLSYVCVVEAGMVAKNGLNSAGLAVATNSLLTTDDPDFGGLPHHAVIARILESRSMTEALAGILGTPRAAGANYLLASAGGEAVNVETGPGARMAFPTMPVAGLLAHANDFVGPPSLANRSGVSLGSAGRLRRVEAQMQAWRGEVTKDSVRDLLSSHAGATRSAATPRPPAPSPRWARSPRSSPSRRSSSTSRTPAWRSGPARPAPRPGTSTTSTGASWTTRWPRQRGPERSARRSARLEFPEAAQDLFRGDREVDHADAGRAVDRIADRGRDGRQRRLPHPVDLGGLGILEHHGVEVRGVDDARDHVVGQAGVRDLPPVEDDFLVERLPDAEDDVPLGLELRPDGVDIRPAYTDPWQRSSRTAPVSRSTSTSAAATPSWKVAAPTPWPVSGSRPPFVWCVA